MRIPEDIDWVMELLAEAKRTGRPIECCALGEWAVLTHLHFHHGESNYRVQPPQPQPKFRPMNSGELIQLARRGVIVEADFGNSVCIGLLQYVKASERETLFTVCGRKVNPEKIRYADTREPIQVED